MGLSVFVAKVIALMYIAAGIAALSGKISYGKIVEDFERSPGLTFVTGFITLIIGMLLVTYHNMWAKDWTVLITVIGWISLFKGVMFIAFPQAISVFKGWYKNTRAWGIVMIAFGILFAYFGFIM
jgi:predicted MFS family arabinose efflux permease